MQNRKKIRVLVVDDSALFREVLSRGISTDSDLEVVATANDPFDARDKILKYKPDVMTCDIQMPRMDGIEFIRQLLPQYPIPVIVISTVSSAVFDAMDAGAVDFITKPSVSSVEAVREFIYDLNYKIRIASTARILSSHADVHYDKPAGAAAATDTDKIIAIGASTGGTEAISQIITSLPENMPGIVIVQHIPPLFSLMFAQRLNTTAALEVKEAQNGDYVEAGKVLIAPGDKHMRIKRLNGKYKVECFEGEKVNGHCPSVDVLFDSVARAAGDKAIGIILTGMGYDGAKGLLEMKKNGAKAIGQDEASCVVYGMPKVAYNIGAVDKQVPLDSIAKTLLSILR
jgi:two-component system chemotaxis response regulator CheB